MRRSLFLYIMLLIAGLAMAQTETLMHRQERLLKEERKIENRKIDKNIDIFCRGVSLFKEGKLKEALQIFELCDSTDKWLYNEDARAKYCKHWINYCRSKLGLKQRTWGDSFGFSGDSIIPPGDRSKTMEIDYLLNCNKHFQKEPRINKRGISLKTHKEYLELALKELGDNNIDYAYQLLFVSNYGSIKNSRYSIDYLYHAMNIYASLYGKEHPAYGYTLSALARKYFNYGIDYKAKEALEQAMGIWEKLYGNNSNPYLNDLALLCDIYMSKEDYQKVVQCQEKLIKAGFFKHRRYNTRFEDEKDMIEEYAKYAHKIYLSMGKKYSSQQTVDILSKYVEDNKNYFYKEYAPKLKDKDQNYYSYYYKYIVVPRTYLANCLIDNWRLQEASSYCLSIKDSIDKVFLDNQYTSDKLRYLNSLGDLLVRLKEYKQLIDVANNMLRITKKRNYDFRINHLYFHGYDTNPYMVAGYYDYVASYFKSVVFDKQGQLDKAIKTLEWIVDCIDEVYNCKDETLIGVKKRDYNFSYVFFHQARLLERAGKKDLAATNMSRYSKWKIADMIQNIIEKDNIQREKYWDNNKIFWEVTLPRFAYQNREKAVVEGLYDASLISKGFIDIKKKL